jgi:hypothetical protein
MNLKLRPYTRTLSGVRLAHDHDGRLASGVRPHDHDGRLGSRAAWLAVKSHVIARAEQSVGRRTWSGLKWVCVYVHY